MKSVNEMASEWRLNELKFDNFAIGWETNNPRLNKAFLAGFKLAIEMLRSEEAAEMQLEYFNRVGRRPDPHKWADWLSERLEEKGERG